MASASEPPRRVALYARLSVAKEESVSIARQLEAGRKYAELRGWTVVLEAIDDGVSATKNRPEDRVGWREILDSPETFEAVIVWKVDRLARRVLDFLHADEALRNRGAGIVAVEDPIDMTTHQGRMFATVLAAFGESEAAAISDRVTAARRTLVTSGRRAGGRPPFGWRNVPNPDGPGMVLAKDPMRIDTVKVLAARALAGESLYSLARWLESEGVAPRAREGRKDGHRWHDASVESILRSPALAGLTAFDGDVLRDGDGLPVVDESVAILTTQERRRLLATLDRAKRPGTRQRAGAEPALLYGLIRCATCRGLMYRATAAGKYRQYRCQQKGCPRPVGIARDAVEEHVVAVVMAEVGDRLATTPVELVTEDNSSLLGDVEAAIRDTIEAMALDGADIDSLTTRLATLKEARASARDRGPTQRQFRVSGETLKQKWGRTPDVEERRQLLLGWLEAIYISAGGGRGRAFDPSRVDPRWIELDSDEERRRQRQEDITFMRPGWTRVIFDAEDRGSNDAGDSL